MPDVVDSDEDRNYVGLERDRIRIEAVEKLISTVTADSEIDKVKFYLGMRLRNELGSELRIAVTHVVIVSLVATRIGDAVTLEENSELFHCILLNDLAVN